MTTLHERLSAAAARDGERIALSLDEAVLTFSDLERQSTALAHHLTAAGVGAGDPVVLISNHALEAVVAFWGVMKAGGIAVQLNAKMGDDALRGVLRECAPKAVLASGKYLDDVTTKWLADPSDIVIRDLMDPTLREPCQTEGASLAPVQETDPACIIYTSGSTGQPKGVCLSHRNLWTVAGAVIDDLGVTSKDAYLMVVPLHYVHGIMQLLVHHLAGASVHLAPSFMFPQVIVKKLKTLTITSFSGVPFHFNTLIENSTFLKEELPDLRWLTSTGGKLDEAQIQKIRAAKPDVNFLIAYGQTECAPRATALAPDRIDRKPTSVGTPIKGVTVLILDEEGNALPQGAVGEVVIAGDNIMMGYWRQPEATAKVLDGEGRLHTGDLGRFDEEGDLFLVGRRSDMIKSAGERIFPGEIETVLRGSGRVLEAAVIGVPHPVTGEQVEAHLRIDPKAPDFPGLKAMEEELRKLCLAHMPIARAPKRFHFWAEFPRRDNGKVDRLKLAKGDGGEPVKDEAAPTASAS